MKTNTAVIALQVVFLILACASTQRFPTRVANPPLERFGALKGALDTQRFALGYPALIRKLECGTESDRASALHCIASSGEIDAIPLVVELMRTTDSQRLRTMAAVALRDIVSDHELKRRDYSRPSDIYLLPRGPDHVDLRPLARVVEEMLKAEQADPELLSDAATIVGYVQLYQFEERMKELCGSPHPAVQHRASFALRLLHQTEDRRTSAQADEAEGPLHRP